MVMLYLVSDIILACLFEPIIHLLGYAGRRMPRFGRFLQAFKESMNKTIAKYGIRPGPFTLVMVSFGVDPMTGRTAAKAAGHGFVSGWSLAICGDLIFFSVIMISTLCLNNLLGDGTWTAVIIMVAMMIVPNLSQRLRARWRKRTAG
jgi:hypothetical protein